MNKTQLAVEEGEVVMKYPNIMFGRVEAVWNKLGGEEGVDLFLRGELSVSKPERRWCEHGGIIYLSVISDGTTGLQWIDRLEGKNLRVGGYAKTVLRSDDFRPTNGVITEVAVLKGMLFEDNDRITKNIRAEAERRKWAKPNAEVSCLIRENFSDQDIEAMGLWAIIGMHELINDSDGDPRLLAARRGDDGRWLNAYYDRPGYGWDRDDGFAFVASQVGA